MTMTKWLGPAAWNKKEARAGDRLPYACHIDASTLRLRDGSLMRCMRLAGFPFETEDDDIWDEHRMEPQEFIDAGDRVVVLQREYQRSNSGVEMTIETAGDPRSA